MARCRFTRITLAQKSGPLLLPRVAGRVKFNFDPSTQVAFPAGLSARVKQLKLGFMSTAIELLQRLNQHRAWVNENLVAAAAGLDLADLGREFAIGQGSVWKSLVHMYAAEYVWLATLQGNEQACCPGDVPGKLPGNQLGEGAIQSLAELREKWLAQDRQWLACIDAFSAKSLDELVYRVAVSMGGTRIPIHRSDAVLHCCLHAHYTSAQIINMLRQLGHEKFPKTMLMHLAWQEGASR